MSWLRNLQGQLSELAQEVLSEATEEVQDPETELQVAKKKCAEAERILAIEQAKANSLDEKVKNLETQLYESNVQMDEISAKYESMVRTRDDEIKKLQIQMEQMNEAGWNEPHLDDDFDLNAQQIADLQREVAHWKSLAGAANSPANQWDMLHKSELDRRLEEFRQKKEAELAAVVEQHAESMAELREMYEDRILSLQQYPASSSTSNADVLDAVMLEKEELLDTKKKLEDMVRSKNSGSSGSDSEKEKPVMVELFENRDELIERLRSAEAELERLREEKADVEATTRETENLREQNHELTAAYNDLERDFEDYKEQTQNTLLSNVDLQNRINGLRANLVEYEERYELCKRENVEVLAQLARLNEDFERLRQNVASVQARRSGCDSLGEEVEKLRAALDESVSDREQLRTDVQHFREAVADIDSEMDTLRSTRANLTDENRAMAENLQRRKKSYRYETTMKDIISSSEKDIEEVRKQFAFLQTRHESERESFAKENSALRDEIDSLHRQNELLREESKLIAELNAQLKSREEIETRREHLYMEKLSVMENLLQESNGEIGALQSELGEYKIAYENLKDQFSGVRRQVAYCDESASLEGRGEHEAGWYAEHKSAENLMPSTSSAEPKSSLEEQLREALLANNEKTEECESLREQNRELEKEIGIRQSCVDEMIAQTNTLQLQQQQTAQVNHELRQEVLAREREQLRTQQELANERDHTADLLLVVRNMEKLILGDDDDEEEEKESEVEDVTSSTSRTEETSDETTNANRAKVEELKKNGETLRRYLRGLKKKCEAQEEELVLVRSEMSVMSAETEKTRSQLENELHEAEVVDRSLLEGIEKRVVSMEVELAKKIDELEESRRKHGKDQSRIDELEKEKGDLKQQISDLLEKSEEQPTNDEETFHELSQLVAEKQTEVDSLRQKLARLEDDVTLLTTERQNRPNEEPNEEQQQQIRHLETANEELRELLVQKHTESTNYYQQLESWAARSNELEVQLAAVGGRLAAADEKVRVAAEQADKRGRELERLKQHLVLVEETSTREAVDAEQRETQLRERVRELELLGNAASEGASESTQQYQVQIASLTARLESTDKSLAEWKTRCAAEQKAREQTQEALSSLQGVVRELSTDHERESATTSHRNLDLQAQIENLQEAIGDLKAELERQSLGRQSAEDDVDRQRLQIDAKQKIIEELEMQIEEIRVTKSSKEDESYRIDDVTLRQLFLSLFTSDATKRADIALLLASILEYPPDQMDKVRGGVRSCFGGSSSVLNTSPGGRPTTSLTEQFIRFLEVESESARTAPHLPVPSSDAPRISLSGQNSPGASSDRKNPPHPTSSAALDSILR